MTLLITQGELDFTHLKKALKLSDGNLSAHLRILEEAGYVTVNKTFLGKRPKTIFQASSTGHLAYTTYLNQLESILKFYNNEPS